MPPAQYAVCQDQTESLRVKPESHVGKDDVVLFVGGRKACTQYSKAHEGESARSRQHGLRTPET